MATQLQIRRGTAAQVAAFTGAEGEIVYNSTNDSLHTNDGATAGGFELARADLNNVSDANLNAALTGNTLSALTITTLTATGGTINGTVIGGTTAAAGSFTTGTFSSTLGVTGVSTLAAMTATTGTFSSDVRLTAGLLELDPHEAGLVTGNATGKVYSTGSSYDGTNGSIVLQARSTAGASAYIVTGGTPTVQLKIDSAGAATFSGAVGVGIAPSTYGLEVANAASTSIAYQRTGVSAKLWGFTSDNDQTIWSNITDGVSALALSNTGAATFSAGITATGLTVTGTNANLTLGTSGNDITFARNADNYISASGGSSSNIVLNPQNRLVVSTAGVERFRVDSSGSVGIGTSSPSTTLHLKDTRATLRLEPEAIGGTTFDMRNGVSGVTEGGMSFYDVTNSATRLTIDASGNLTLGSAALSATVGLKFQADTGTFTLAHDRGSHALVLSDSDGSGELLRVDTSGNLLVGTSNTTWNSAAGLRYFNGGALIVTRSADAPLFLNRLSSDGAIAEFTKDGTTVGVIGTGNSGNLYIGSGDAGINFNKDINAIYPINAGTGGGSNGVLDLGYGGIAFKDLYLTGTVNAGAATFSGDVNLSTSNAVLNVGGGGFTQASYGLLGLSGGSGGMVKMGTSGTEQGVVYANAGGLTFGTPATFPMTWYPAGALAMTLDTSGNLLVGTGSGSNHIIQKSNASAVVLQIINSSATSPAGAAFIFSAAAPNNGTATFFTTSDTGGYRGGYLSNGGLQNYQSNDSNLSDEREKNQFGALESTTACLREWEVVKYLYKDEDQTHPHKYGVIAQQVAPHCPEVITDWVKVQGADEVLWAEEDDDIPEGVSVGDVKTEAVEQVDRIGVKEQQMFWMLVKSHQEALDTIDALTARIDALEGA